MKIVYRIFLICTAFMSVVSLAGPLEQLNIQSCNYICGVSEFQAIISEGSIHNTVMITTTDTNKEIQIFILKTLNVAYHKLCIFDINSHHVSDELKKVFQSMPSKQTIYIVFDSAFIEKKCLLPLSLIEAMYSLTAFKQGASVPIKNDDKVDKITTNRRYCFFLCVWNRKETSLLSIQEKKEKIDLIIRLFDKTLSSFMQQNTADLQTNHYQKTYDFIPSAQPTPYQCFLASPPAYFMPPPGSSPEYFMPPPSASLAYFMPPLESSPAHFMPLPLPRPSPAHFMPLPGPSPVHFMPPPGPSPVHLMRPPTVPPLPHSSHMPPFIGSHAPKQPYVRRPPILPSPPLPCVSQTTHSDAQHTHNASEKFFYDTQYPFLQQVYKIGCFEVPICGKTNIRTACMKQFGYITFNDYTHDKYFFLSNYFFCETPFSIDNQKTQWRSAIALTSSKKLDYFNPPLPTVTKEYFFNKLKKYDDCKAPYYISQTLKEFKTGINEAYVFQKQVWKNISASLVFQTLYCKFNSNETLKKNLLETGDHVLIYQHVYKNYTQHPTIYYNDCFWGGNTTNDSGYNVLGNLLCLVREYFKNNKPPPPFMIYDIKKF